MNIEFQNPIVGIDKNGIRIQSPVAFSKTKTVVERVHDSDYKRPGVTFGGGKTKYGNIRYSEAGFSDNMQQRENARGVYHDSLIARGIVNRLVDNVINTGLTWESSPLWSMIPGATTEDEARYQFTEQVENRFTLYTHSTEPDIRGRLTFSQIQRLLYLLRVKEGEYFCILRYLNSPQRMSPLAIQVLNNDQVTNPLDAVTLSAIRDRSATVKDGIEYDSTGKAVAIYVRENEMDFGKNAIRIPMFGPRSGRRFVIHDGNFETADQFRGFPELSAMVYELDRLTEYDISELEAVVAGALWFAAIETEKGATTKGPILKPNTLNANTSNNLDTGDNIKEVNIGKRALVMQNLGPGQTFKGFQPNRPNPNFAAFEEVFETRICTALGMPLSVYRQKFAASYSAARAEILFFWNNIYRRRDDFISGLLNPFYESWFTEEVNAGNINAPGYKTIPIVKRAWLHGTWNGISRPVVDPVKEVRAVAERQKLGHTTGEREAKAYNGSDFRENTKRLTSENPLIAEANKPLDPMQFADPEMDNGGTDNDTEDE